MWQERRFSAAQSFNNDYGLSPAVAFCVCLSCSRVCTPGFTHPPQSNQRNRRDNCVPAHGGHRGQAFLHGTPYYPTYFSP